MRKAAHMTTSNYSDKEREQLSRLIGELISAYSNPNIPRYIKGAGICRLLYYIEWFGFTIDEREKLIQYLEKNLPKGTSKYNWPKGETAPRIEWLRLQLKNLR